MHGSTSKRKRVTADDFSPVDPRVLPEKCRLDLADCEVYYVDDFVDPATSDLWYKQLLELPTCERS